MVGKKERWVREVLSGLSDRGFVARVNQRSGWTLTQPPIIDLYAAAGLPPPPRVLDAILAEIDSL